MIHYSQEKPTNKQTNKQAKKNLNLRTNSGQLTRRLFLRPNTILFQFSISGFFKINRLNFSALLMQVVI